VIISRIMRWRGMWHVWGTGGVYKMFWWKDLIERHHFEDPSVDGRIITKWTFDK
jgi:hypothetical protein